MLDKTNKMDMFMRYFIVLIIGLFFGIAFGVRIERGSSLNNAELRADIEMIKNHAELAGELDRIITIYNNELKEVMENYSRALKILENGR